MKQYSLIFSFILFSTFSFSQDFTTTFLKVDFLEASKESSVELLRQYFRHEVYPLHSPAYPISKTKLSTAKLMSDLISEYPSSWVSNYVSTEILVVSNKKTKKVIGINGTLNRAQKNLLKEADLNTKVFINIKYKQENSATGKIEVNNLNFLIAVVPDREAIYIGGVETLQQYLKKNILDRISDAELKELKQGSIEFTINEKGNVGAIQLKEQTGNPSIDQLFFNVINSMPQWEPAKNSKGIPVKQQFKFVAGSVYDGC